MGVGHVHKHVHTPMLVLPDAGRPRKESKQTGALPWESSIN